VNESIDLRNEKFTTVASQVSERFRNVIHFEIRQLFTKEKERKRKKHKINGGRKINKCLPVT
jgi:hypothetical protein